METTTPTSGSQASSRTKVDSGVNGGTSASEMQDRPTGCSDHRDINMAGPRLTPFVEERLNMPQSRGSSDENLAQRQITGRRTAKCHNCGEVGHFAKNCMGPKRDRAGRNASSLVASLKDGLDRQEGNDHAMRQLATDLKEANGLLSQTVVEVSKLEKDLAQYRERSEARILTDIAKFDIAYGAGEMWTRRWWIVSVVLVALFVTWLGSGILLTVMALCPYLTIAWIFWPVMGRRMTFDGHYEYHHEDLRPDVIRTKDVVHAPKYGWILYSRQTWVGCKQERLLISYEALAQLCSPDLMRLDREYKTVMTAIQSAIGRMPTVSYSKYLPISGEDLMQNTGLVACGKFLQMTTRVRKLDFGLSLAPT